MSNARVVHKYVDRICFHNDGFDNRSYLCLFGNVTFVKESSSLESIDLINGYRGIVIKVQDMNVTSLFCEKNRNCFSYSAAAAGDDRDFIFKTKNCGAHVVQINVQFSICNVQFSI